MPALQTWHDAGEISFDALKRLEEFAALILKWNPRINLTGFKSQSEIEELLIGESIAALRALHLANVLVADFGSGAGIPGLVWAICEPSLKVTSIEIRQKKTAFQKEVRRLFQLEVEILGSHFPEAVQGRSFDVIVSRAIRFDSPVWAQARSVLAPRGLLVRFTRPGSVESGWESLPVSSRTELLIAH